MIPCSSATKLVYQTLFSTMARSRWTSRGGASRLASIGKEPKVINGASRLTHSQRPAGVVYSAQPSIAK